MLCSDYWHNLTSTHQALELDEGVDDAPSGTQSEREAGSEGGEEEQEEEEEAAAAGESDEDDEMQERRHVGYAAGSKPSLCQACLPF